MLTLWTLEGRNWWQQCVVHVQDRGSDRTGQGAQQRDQQDGSFWQQLSTLGTDLFGSGSLSPTHQQQPSSSPLLASKGALPESAPTSDRQKEPLTAAAPPGLELLSEAALPISAQQVDYEYILGMFCALLRDSRAKHLNWLIPLRTMSGLTLN